MSETSALRTQMAGSDLNGWSLELFDGFCPHVLAGMVERMNLAGTVNQNARLLHYGGVKVVRPFT